MRVPCSTERLVNNVFKSNLENDYIVSLIFFTFASLIIVLGMQLNNYIVFICAIIFALLETRNSPLEKWRTKVTVFGETTWLVRKSLITHARK